MLCTKNPKYTLFKYTVKEFRKFSASTHELRNLRGVVNRYSSVVNRES